MPSTFYDVLSEYYDFLQGDIDTKAWAEYVHALIIKHCSSNSEDTPVLCDLGCGTGKTTLEFVNLGYDITGIDNSANMLTKAMEQTGEDVKATWVMQDITEFEFCGQADVFVSLLDTINHITNPDKVRNMLSGVSKYLKPGGVFIFDVGSRKHFEETLGDNIFYQDYDNFTLFWENEYSNQMSVSNLTIFYSKDAENYKRVDGKIREKYYSIDVISQMAEANGLKLAGVYGDLSEDEPADEDERIFIVLKREE